jgi:hypothetical protein
MDSDHKWSEFIGVLNAIGECSIVCPYYKTCSFVPYSPVCMVKEMCEADLRRYFNLYILGEEGMRAEIMGKLFELGALTDNTNPLDIIKYLEQLLKVNRQVYSERRLLREPIEEEFRIEVTSNGFGHKQIPAIIVNEQEDEESLIKSPLLDTILNDNSKRKSTS